MITNGMIYQNHRRIHTPGCSQYNQWSKRDWNTPATRSELQVVDASFGWKQRMICATSWDSNPSLTFLPGPPRSKSAYSSAGRLCIIDSIYLSLSHGSFHCHKWRSPADRVTDLGGLTVQAHCLSGHALSLSTTTASSTIISQHIVAYYATGIEC